MSWVKVPGPYELLANAIVALAAEDYREANRRLRRRRVNREAENMRKDCLEFFRSGWFTLLTDLDPEALIQSLDAEFPQDHSGLGTAYDRNIPPAPEAGSLMPPGPDRFRRSRRHRKKRLWKEQKL